jgi:hypothetical protein
MRYFVLFLILCSFSNLEAQSLTGADPFSWTSNIEYTAKVKSYSDVPFKELVAEDLVNDQDKSIPWRFGYDFTVNLDPGVDGEYIDFDNGDRLWRIKIKSTGAKTMNIFFDWFRLEKGAWMQVADVYGQSKSKLFTNDQNNPNDAIGIWPVATDEVWVEFFEPAAVKGLSKLSLGNVVYGYRTTTDFDEAKALNQSGACNQDVDCDITPNGPDFYNINQVKEDVKKSVAMMVTGNTGFCTGALVNNTTNDGTPYFMTANHCVGGSVAGWAFRFNWRSTTARCATFQNSISGAFDQTASGATLKMSSSESDMALVEITDSGFFNASPDVVWAGWNRSTSQTPNINFGVHHPSGDIQKTCRDDQGANRNTRSFNGNNTTEMWLISNWDLGVTERGSSGSPLFNENGHIIGVLSGGSAACSGTADNGGIDYYGRVGVGWSFGGSSSSRLRDWLDPNNTGQLTLDQFPPNNPLNFNVSVSVSDISDGCSDVIEPEVLISNLGIQTITTLTILYPDGSGGTATLNYAGNIAQNSSDTISLPSFDLNGNTITYNVLGTNPNGTTDEDTSNNTASTVFNPSSVTNYSSNGTVTFTILTDRFPTETSWEFRTVDGTLLQSGNRGSLSGQSTTLNRTLNVQNGACYEFTIFDSSDDGICCGFGFGDYSLTSDSGQVIFDSSGDFGSSEVTKFSIGFTTSLGDDVFTDLTITPNPSTGMFFINSSLFGSELTYNVYDLSGKLLVNGSVNNSGSSFDLSQVNDGMYFVEVMSMGASKTFKIIKR